jgi:phage FluMu gp28-like protein
MVTLAADLAAALDPVAFAMDAIGWTPDAWQAEVLRSSARRLALCCCRQSGKSTTAAVLATWRAVFYPGSLVLVVSPSIRQSSEWFRRVQGFLDRLDERPRLVEDNKLSLELGNGSRVVSLPSSEETIRGFSAAALVIEDEAARVLDQTNEAVRAMIAIGGGRLILLSTPNGRRGHFYDIVEGAQATEQWLRVRVPWTDCPRLEPAFVEGERRALPQSVFASEWLCEFTDTQDAVFLADDIQSLFDDPAARPLFPDRLPSQATEVRHGVY